jgi:hypothetical protein
MRGYLKQSSTIPQCRQCFSLRYADLQGTPCPTCLRLLGEVFTDVTMLPLSAASFDAPVKLTVVPLGEGTFV